VQERLIGLNDFTFEIPDKNPQNVGIDQSPDPSFAIFKIAIKPRILKGYRCLERKHLQDADAVTSENVRGQVIFEVENTDEFALVDQWQSENGARAALNDVGIGRKGIHG